MSNWPIVSLSEVADFSSGGTPSKANPSFWDGDIPWVSPKDMKSDCLSDAEDKISAAAVRGSAAKIVGRDSVLAVVRSGILAHSFPVATLATDVSFNQDIKAITPKNGDLLPGFLFWFLKAREDVIVTSGVKKGATVHSVSSGFLEALKFRLPPLCEQQRLVQLMNRAAEIRGRADAARAKARAVIPSLFNDMFGDPASNSRGWRTTMFCDVVRQFRYGTNQKCHDTPTKGDLPVLRIPNVIGGQIDWSDLKFAALPEKERLKTELESGDVLFVRTNGNPEYIGRCAQYHGDRLASYASYLIRARLKADFLPAFAVNLFNHSTYRPLMMRMAKTTAGNFNLSTEGLGALPVILPPVSLQAAFEVEAARVTGIVDRLEAATAKAEAMAAALSSEIFDGPHTRQPSDAEELAEADADA